MIKKRLCMSPLIEQKVVPQKENFQNKKYQSMKNFLEINELKRETKTKKKRRKYQFKMSFLLLFDSKRQSFHFII